MFELHCRGTVSVLQIWLFFELIRTLREKLWRRILRRCE
ncbi:hypothetical protein D917_05943 [Trichinella nativa]|uniref:Uncharacterized protein n=1 Tax=Trichinella nativa TaxID=6335 RepID=A0A1Y3F0H5_9BILA|nr:hypothetical protein D917_05943 [Trichinella nativa]